MTEILDTLPKPGFILKEKGRTYLTDEVIENAKNNPGKYVVLGEGALVDKAYFPSLELQALKIDHRLALEFVLQKRPKTTNATSGIPSYSYRGNVYACFVTNSEEEEAATAMKKARKAEKSARKAARLSEEGQQAA